MRVTRGANVLMVRRVDQAKKELSVEDQWDPARRESSGSVTKDASDRANHSLITP